MVRVEVLCGQPEQKYAVRIRFVVGELNDVRPPAANRVDTLLQCRVGQAQRLDPACDDVDGEVHR